MPASLFASSIAPNVIRLSAGLSSLQVGNAAIRSARAGVWSVVPVFEGLDPSFLRQPLIPRAPLAPRVEVEGGPSSTVRVVGSVGEEELLGDPEDLKLYMANLKRRRLGPWHLLLASLVGVSAGVLLAWILGVI